MKRSMILAAVLLMSRVTLAHAQNPCPAADMPVVLSQGALTEGFGDLVWTYALSAAVGDTDNLELMLDIPTQYSRIVFDTSTLRPPELLAGDGKTWKIGGTSFTTVDHTVKFTITIPESLKTTIKPTLVRYRVIKNYVQDGKPERCLWQTGEVSGPGIAYDPSLFRLIAGPSVSFATREASRDFEVRDGHIYVTNQSRKRPALTVGGLFHVLYLTKSRERGALDLFLTFDFALGGTKTLNSLTFGPALSLGKYVSFFVGGAIFNNKQLGDGFTRAATQYVQNSGDDKLKQLYPVNSVGRNLEDPSFFDGFPMTYSDKDGKTQAIYPGDPLVNRNFAGVRIGFLFPLDIYKLLRGPNGN